MASAKKERSGLHGLEQLPEKLGRSGVAASRVGLDHHAPNRHDTGSTTARSGAARLAAIPAGESPANRGVQSLL
jgi:hypothetical protein